MGKHYKAKPGDTVYVITYAHRKAESRMIECKVTVLTEEKIYVESFEIGKYNRWLKNKHFRINWFKNKEEAENVLNKIKQGGK